MGASLLRTLGMPQLVARNSTHYVALALELSGAGGGAMGAGAAMGDWGVNVPLTRSSLFDQVTTQLQQTKHLLWEDMEVPLEWTRFLARISPNRGPRSFTPELVKGEEAETRGGAGDASKEEVKELNEINEMKEHKEHEELQLEEYLRRVVKSPEEASVHLKRHAQRVCLRKVYDSYTRGDIHIPPTELTSQSEQGEHGEPLTSSSSAALECLSSSGTGGSGGNEGATAVGGAITSAHTLITTPASSSPPPPPEPWLLRNGVAVLESSLPLGAIPRIFCDWGNSASAARGSDCDGEQQQQQSKGDGEEGEEKEEEGEETEARGVLAIMRRLSSKRQYREAETLGLEYERAMGRNMAQQPQTTKTNPETNPEMSIPSSSPSLSLSLSLRLSPSQELLSAELCCLHHITGQHADAYTRCGHHSTTLNTTKNGKLDSKLDRKLNSNLYSSKGGVGAALLAHTCAGVAATHLSSVYPAPTTNITTDTDVDGEHLAPGTEAEDEKEGERMRMTWAEAAVLHLGAAYQLQQTQPAAVNRNGSFTNKGQGEGQGEGEGEIELEPDSDSDSSPSAFSVSAQSTQFNYLTALHTAGQHANCRNLLSSILFPSSDEIKGPKADSVALKRHKKHMVAYLFAFVDWQDNNATRDTLRAAQRSLAALITGEISLYDNTNTEVVEAVEDESDNDENDDSDDWLLQGAKHIQNQHPHVMNPALPCLLPTIMTLDGDGEGGEEWLWFSRQVIRTSLEVASQLAETVRSEEEESISSSPPTSTSTSAREVEVEGEGKGPEGPAKDVACADGVTLLTQYFLTGEERTQRDLAKALLRNLKNPHISRVVLFWDTQAGNDNDNESNESNESKKEESEKEREQSLLQLQAVLSRHLAAAQADTITDSGGNSGSSTGNTGSTGIGIESLPKGKVFIAPLSSRLLFSTAVTYANEQLPQGACVAIANSDIFFDQTLGVLTSGRRAWPEVCEWSLRGYISIRLICVTIPLINPLQSLDLALSSFSFIIAYRISIILMKSNPFHNLL